MDIFTLSSVFEGLPYVLMEAMALDRPVVATAASGTRDLLRDGHTALVVPVGDHRALAASVVRLADDPDLRLRLGHAGHELVLQTCTTDRQSAQTVQLYRDLVEPPEALPQPGLPMASA